MSLSGASYLTREGLKNVWNNRMMSIASIGVLISCLILTGTAALLSLNVKEAVESIGDSNVTNVYLEEDVNEVEATYVGKQIENVANVTKVEFYSKEEAIKEFESTLGEEVFENMQGENNPLPDTYKITMEDMSLYDETVAKITLIDGVESVSSRSDVANKLTRLDRLISYLGAGIVIALGIISLFIISNAIRMSMYSRRFEISIMKSVGATDAFVRIPFIIEGMAIGLISAIISFGLLYFLYDIMMNAITNIVASVVPIPFTSVLLPVVLSFVAAGLIIGAASGFISVRKYLKKEGNEIIGW